MVGRRRRRTSDSTTGTLDYDGRAFAKELSVLKVHEPELDSREETEMLQTFVLEDATICDKTGRLVELFTVNTQGPFTVRGRVIIDDTQKSRAVKPSTKTALIETRDCTRYAIGVSNNGYGAWAGGQAGWYEIRPPSAAYKEIFDHTIEGVSIYYTILGIIEEHVEAQEAKQGKKRSKKAKRMAAHDQLSIQTLLFKYAVAMGDGATYDEVVERCDDHAHFLLSHFYEDAEIDWSPTVFFKWMTNRHPDIHAKVLELRKKKLGGAKPNSLLPEETEAVALPVASDEPPAQKALSKRRQRNTSESNGSTPWIDSHDFATSQRDTRSRSRGKTKTQSRSPPPVVEPQVETMDVDDIPEDPPQTELVEVAHDRSNVEALIEGIDEIKSELGPLNAVAFPKVSSKLYYKYKIKVYLGASDILKYYAKELTERLNEHEWAGSGFWSTLKEAAQGPRITLEHVKLEQIPDSLVRRKATATTVPRNRSQALSGQGEAQKAAAVATPPPRRVGRPAGKMSGLRLAGTGGKRRFDPDETPESVSRKAAKRSHDYDSDEDEAMDDASSSEDDDSSVDSAGLPAAFKAVVRAENIPTTIPKGPNGTWVCDEDDCDFVERNPESEDGRERIHEHMQDVHYQENENQVERISLAVTEGGKNRLPIEYSSPPPSPDFRYTRLLDVQGEVSPFWELDSSGSTPSGTTLSSQVISDAALEYKKEILPGTLSSVTRSLDQRS
ncbi:uncharacterized protein ColSpa_01015 [Colletotrichum spaethianum]|uniref:DNA (cytosine-5)-methyltransferase 1 replication foci domain-containing protein n=1 Tax=Colletotrichum spaethianum TaxID=700344 RepID=A0AA37P6W8_9PEZI|nr:uncharacterized protein ColSpa_01015 [Colletotrichum spaethianum]GKT40834.1 hypothetical protein ColSpa_01015 [Colletotrichum spaethianum]